MNSIRLLLLCALALPACHHVILDPIPPVAAATLPVPGRFEVDPSSASYAYSLRSFAAGIANKWTIHVGEAVQTYAQSYLSSAFQPGDGVVITFTIENFVVEDFCARLSLRTVVRRGSEEKLNRVYSGTGTSHFKRTAFTGVLGMQGSMKATTAEALRAIFEQFLADARKFSGTW